MSKFRLLLLLAAGLFFGACNSSSSTDNSDTAQVQELIEKTESIDSLSTSLDEKSENLDAAMDDLLNEFEEN